MEVITHYRLGASKFFHVFIWTTTEMSSTIEIMIEMYTKYDRGYKSIKATHDYPNQCVLLFKVMHCYNHSMRM
jgi:hypothetical protein